MPIIKPIESLLDFHLKNSQGGGIQQSLQLWRSVRGLSSDSGTFVRQVCVTSELVREHTKAIAEFAKDEACRLAVNVVSSSMYQVFFYDDEVVAGVVEILRQPFSINTHITGDRGLVGDLFRYLSEKFLRTNRLIKSLTSGMFGIDVVDELLPLARTETVASALHYPHLPTPSELLRDFMNSKAKVLVLIGPPGTGKSTYLRAMIGDLDPERHLYTAAASSVHANPQLLEIMKRSSPDSVFVFEDADLLISARDKGNHQMSEILNITDGITTSDRKFIFSTNLPNLKSVDKALLRPGRCFGTYGFRPLTAEEARPVYEEHNLIMPADYTDSTLAEILNPPNHIGDYDHE